ncbi:MAG: DoxX family protein [Flavobacteriales bacterium]|nr:DoxX family protein [Flavobacteriales bacterium]
MKRINLAYWIITTLFSAFMIFSSIGGITLHEQAVAMLHDHLGYPLYFIQWISVFKIIGAVAILLPVLPARERMGLLRLLHRPGHGYVLLYRGWRSGRAVGVDAALHRGADRCLCAAP